MLRDFHGIFMGFLWDMYGMFMGFYMGYLWDFIWSVLWLFVELCGIFRVFSKVPGDCICFLKLVLYVG